MVHWVCVELCLVCVMLYKLVLITFGKVSCMVLWVPFIPCPFRVYILLINSLIEYFICFLCKIWLIDPNKDDNNNKRVGEKVSKPDFWAKEKKSEREKEASSGELILCTRREEALKGAEGTTYEAAWCLLNTFSKTLILNLCI